MPKLLLANGAEIKPGDTVWTLDGIEVRIDVLDDTTNKLTLTPTSGDPVQADMFTPRGELATRIGARLVG